VYSFTKHTSQFESLK